jgi:hypothetical protein
METFGIAYPPSKTHFINSLFLCFKNIISKENKKSMGFLVFGALSFYNKFVIIDKHRTQAQYLFTCTGGNIMIYVQMGGRMGNQMFSYAFARNLQLKIKRQQKQKLAFDFSRYKHLNLPLSERQKDYALSPFKCDENIVFGERKMNLLQHIALRIYFHSRRYNSEEYEAKYRDIMSLFGIYICTYNYHEFKHKSFFKNLLVLGFYECHDFFRQIDDVITEELSLKNETFSAEGQKIIAELEKPNSVCVQVRRGDFAHPQMEADWCLSTDYYKKAIAKMQELVPNAKFYFFSDDIDWVAENIEMPADSVLVRDLELGVPVYESIHIRSHCKYYILANSTYVWWTQYFCKQPDKIVIAPKKWHNLTANLHTGVYENDWILIEN